MTVFHFSRIYSFHHASLKQLNKQQFLRPMVQLLIRENVICIRPHKGANAKTPYSLNNSLYYSVSGCAKFSCFCFFTLSLTKKKKKVDISSTPTVPSGKNSMCLICLNWTAALGTSFFYEYISKKDKVLHQLLEIRICVFFFLNKNRKEVLMVKY